MGKTCKQSHSERTKEVNNAATIGKHCKQSANERTSVSLVVQKYKITILGQHMGKTCKQSDSERTKEVNNAATIGPKR